MENPATQTHLPLLEMGKALQTTLQEAKSRLPGKLKHVWQLLVTWLARNIEFWLEPGRFFIARAGVLLASVTQLKHKAAFTYVGEQFYFRNT